jgi:hypothetical protein
MKKLFAFSTVLLGTAALIAADSGSVEQVKAALAKLNAAPNYSWVSQTEMPGSQFQIGPATGKTEKGGFTMVRQEFGENTTEVFMKGESAAVKVEDEWQLTSDLEAGQGNRGAMLARFIARMKKPAEEVGDLLAKVETLKAGDGGALVGDLTGEAAQELVAFSRGRRGGDNAPPPPRNAKGSVKFWLKEGQLVKYQLYTEATMTIRDEERDVKRTRTTEIKDVGSTKLEVPAEAKKKLSP